MPNERVKTHYESYFSLEEAIRGGKVTFAACEIDM